MIALPYIIILALAGLVAWLAIWVAMVKSDLYWRNTLLAYYEQKEIAQFRAAPQGVHGCFDHPESDRVKQLREAHAKRYQKEREDAAWDWRAFREAEELIMDIEDGEI